MQTIHNTHPVATRKHDGIHDASLFGQFLQATAAAFRRFHNRRKIHHMLDLSPHLLKDIGLTRSDVVDAIGSSRFEDPIEVLNARRNARIGEQTGKMYGRKR